LLDEKGNSTLFVLIQSINSAKDKNIMPRIIGVNIPEQKQILIALTYIYGIGRPLSKKILQMVQVNPNKRTSELTEEELNRIQKIITDNYKVEGDLRRMVIGDIKRLKIIGCWRGIRHQKGLPVRGQTTRKNSRTIRGNIRKTMTSGRRPASQPT